MVIKSNAIEYKILKENIIVDNIGKIDDYFFYFQEI
jgi:hypothetical protein